MKFSKEMKKEIIYSIVLIIISVNAFFFGYLAGDFYDYTQVKVRYMNSINASCVGEDLNNTAVCLHSKVDKIFKYNITDDLIYLTEEELIERGGDCKNWAEYYYSIYDSERFYGNVETFLTTSTTAHSFFVLSNNEGYCILDQNQPPRCTFFEAGGNII